MTDWHVGSRGLNQLENLVVVKGKLMWNNGGSGSTMREGECGWIFVPAASDPTNVLKGR